MHLRRFLVLLLLVGLAAACSDQNSPVDQAHPGNWVLTHGTDPGAQGSAQACTPCHGANLGGGSVGVACLDCHMEGPPFAIHPAEWANAFVDHRAFAQEFSWTACANAACHGEDLRGGSGSGETGPSCFSDEWDGQGCHGDGPPPPASHEDASGSIVYVNPELHGPDAKGRATSDGSLDPASSQFYCRNCHGEPLNLFDGGYVADPDILDRPLGACSNCHEDARAHPTSWVPVPGASRHASTPEAAWTVGCGLCHEVPGQQGTSPLPAAPSCFADSFENPDGVSSACHGEEGPQPVPHPIDGSYLLGSNHGPDAKADLTFCQLCHGEPGGPGDNPRFNQGIEVAGGEGCEGCHGVNYAHPQVWAGPNPPNAFHYTAGNIQNACTLCHGVDLDGVGGVGVSCLDCHLSAETFTLDCTACHGEPPDATSDESVVEEEGGVRVDHSGVPLSPHDACSVCHGVKEGATAGTFSAVPNYNLFDYESDVNGDHWNGSINMNGPSPSTGAGYNETNFGCDNALCHGNDLEHRLSDSELPVAFGDYGSVGGAPHPLDGSYFLPSAHGTDAKADLTFCQPCHGEAGGPGDNPRFNRGIELAGGNGCEPCHGVNYAHPPDWAGPNGTFHYTAGNIQNACSLCHGAALDGVGGVGVSCLDCHINVDTFALDCRACHGEPPDSTSDEAVVEAEGGVRVDHSRKGQSGTVADIAGHNVCVVCHGMKEGGTPGTFDAVANYRLFDAQTETNGDHWNGSINMNSGTGYNQQNHGCDAAGCHGNNTGHQLSDSQLSVTLADYGGGFAHEVGWLDRQSAAFHALSTLDCAACHDLAVDCAQCHFGPSGSRVPAGETWTHGSVPHDFLTQYVDVCENCHAIDRSYGVNIPNCNHCH